MLRQKVMRRRLLLLAALLILHSSDPKLISDADFLASADSGARRQVVEYLLKRGADPGIANHDGQTALGLRR